jgi:hypothetical protein
MTGEYKQNSTVSTTHFITVGGTEFALWPTVNLQY